MQLACPSLEHLREIAFERWDVVRAVSDSSARAGDYDLYLVEAADRLGHGASNDEIADYFINVATDELGIDTGSGMRARALIFARAMRDFVEAAAPIDAASAQR
jgi:hypothetical protein